MFPLSNQCKWIMPRCKHQRAQLRLTVAPSGLPCWFSWMFRRVNWCLCDMKQPWAKVNCRGLLTSTVLTLPPIIIIIITTHTHTHTLSQIKVTSNQQALVHPEENRELGVDWSVKPVSIKARRLRRLQISLSFCADSQINLPQFN